MNDKICKVLESNQRINKLFNVVKDLLEDQGKELEIFVLNEKSNSHGETINCNQKIEIIINDKELQYDKFVAVFIHELGEAHYIASNLPKIIYDSYELISPYLYEIFTHYYINKLVEFFDLKKEFEPIQNNYNKINITDEKWKDIILHVHSFITWGDKEDFSENKEYSKYILDIIDILDKINYFDVRHIDIKFVETIYKQVISILVDLGAPSDIKIEI